MALTGNKFCLVAASVEYACTYLPASIKVAPHQREMFLEINPGHLPSLARTWMSRAQIVALPAGVLEGTKPLAVRIGGMAYNPTTDKIEASELTTQEAFYLVAVLPVSGLDVSAGTVTPNPVYECLWASHQRVWQLWDNQVLAYNMLSADRTAYVNGTAKTGTTVPYTVQEILDAIEPVDLGLVPATVTPPHNFALTETPSSANIARLFRPYAWQLQYNVWTGAYAVKALAYTDATDTLLLADYESVQYEGDSPDAEDMALGQRTPANVNVAFPKYPKTVPGSGGLRYTYTNIVNPATIGPTDSAETILAGDYFDVASPTYTQVLADIGAERGARYFARTNIVPRTCIFNGHYSTMLPNTQIRRVRLSADVDGTHTTVQIHGLYDCSREDHHTKFEIHGRVKAPHWPEHNETFNSVVNQRDDGTVELETVPDITGRKDYLVNGNFLIWQRGTSIEQPTSQTPFGNDARSFGPDQWRIESDGNNIIIPLAARETEVGDATGLCTLYVDGANKKFGLSQAIESRRLGGVEGNYLTFSFYAKRTGTTIGHLRAAILGFSGCAAAGDDTDLFPIVSAWNAAGTDPTFGPEWTLLTPANTNLADLTANYQRFTVKTTASVTTDYRNIAVMFWADDTTINQSDTVIVKQAQLEIGQSASDFEYQGIDKDIQLCQRYFQKTFRQDVAPQQKAGSEECALYSMANASGDATFSWNLAVLMWAKPVAITYNPYDANDNARNLNLGTNTALSTNRACERSFGAESTDIDDARDVMAVHVTMEARL